MIEERLCLVIPTLQPGGTERAMSQLAQYFCKKGKIEVHIILYGKSPELFYSLPENLIVHMPDEDFNDRQKFISTIDRLLYLRKSINGIYPDHVLSFGELWNSFVLLSLTGLHYPVFISDRCSPARKFNLLHTLLRRVLYPYAKGVIAQTEMAKNLYAYQFRHKNICVIGNPVRKIENNKPDIVRENIVLNVGRLIKSKHHDKLIELFAGLDVPGWKLVIVGADADNQKNQEYLQALIRNLNAEDRVILAGKQSDTESFYLKSKVFAFTSSSEGFPNVVGEAMSAGLPVVAFDCVAGPSEMITDNKNGFLVPLFNYEHFKEKLLKLINSPELRDQFGKEAKKSIDRFSPEVIGEKFYSFITSK